MPSYETIVEDFANEKCTLLTTKEEWAEIHPRNPKFRYTASCGHDHAVFYNVFKYRKTGILCPSCTRQRNDLIQKIKMSTNKLGRLESELYCINYFIENVKSLFHAVKAFDGCKADIIVKPHACTEDNWIGIQVKSCTNLHANYGFQITKDYSGYLMFLMCHTNHKMWLIPYEEMTGNIKVSIGLYKSKYSKFEVTKENIMSRLDHLYKETTIKNFEELDTSVNLYQRREKEYQNHRESKIDFITFKRNTMEGLVYDFFIGTKRVQEKVGGLRKDGRNNTYIFGLTKCNGKLNKKINRIQYDIGDNDFYWLNCDNKRDFFVIPESVLLERGIIGNTNTTKRAINSSKIFHINFNCVKLWLKPYQFDYENVDKDRLLLILKC